MNKQSAVQDLRITSTVHIHCAGTLDLLAKPSRLDVGGGSPQIPYGTENELFCLFIYLFIYLFI
jgi:hypothetical protein